MYAFVFCFLFLRRNSILLYCQVINAKVQVIPDTASQAAGNARLSPCRLLFSFEIQYNREKLCIESLKTAWPPSTMNIFQSLNYATSSHPGVFRCFNHTFSYSLYLIKPNVTKPKLTQHSLEARLWVLLLYFSNLSRYSSPFYTGACQILVYHLFPYLNLS